MPATLAGLAAMALGSGAAASTDELSCLDSVSTVSVSASADLAADLEHAIARSAARSVHITLQAAHYTLKRPIELKPGRCVVDVLLRGAHDGTVVDGGSVADCQSAPTEGTPGVSGPALWCAAPTASVASAAPAYYKAPGPVEPAAVNFVEDGRFAYPLTSSNAGYARIVDHGQDAAGRWLQLSSGTPDDLAAPAALVMHGFFGNDFRDEFIPLLRTGSDGKAYLAKPPFYAIKTGQRARIEAWPVARRLTPDGTARFPLPCGEQACSSGPVIAVTLPSLLQVRPGLARISLSSLTMQHANGVGIDIEGAGRIQLEHIQVRLVGVTAMRLRGVGGGQVSDCHLSAMGGGGIDIAAGDRATLEPARVVIERCTIEDFGLSFPSAHPAIRLDGVGITVRNNRIAHGPHSAIMFQGNDHVIADNMIRNVVQHTGDAGAIYTGRDWAAQGSVVERNDIRGVHGLPPQGGTAIYVDDQASGVTVRDNTMHDVHRALLIGGGRSVVVTGNTAADCGIGLQFDARGLSWQRSRTFDPAWDLLRRLGEVPYRSEAYAKYPHLAGLLDDAPGAPKYNRFDSNTFECHKPLSISRDAVPYYRAGPAP